MSFLVQRVLVTTDLPSWDLQLRSDPFWFKVFLAQTRGTQGATHAMTWQASYNPPHAPPLPLRAATHGAAALLCFLPTLRQRREPGDTRWLLGGVIVSMRS